MNTHCFSSSWPLDLLAPAKLTLTTEVRDKGHYANDDEINTNQIIEYLGENHYNDAENETCYPHP